MTLSKLIEELFQHGVELWISGEQLYHRDPQGRLTPELATRLEQYKTTILSSLRQNKGESAFLYPLSSAQKTLWFLYQVAPNSLAYNIKFSAHILSDIDITAFRNAFQKLIDRHHSLRTTYTTLDEIPVQLVHESQLASFEVIDASTWSQEHLHKRMLEEADRPFDLGRGPILRMYLFSRSPEKHILWLLIHHIAIDVCSFETLIEELGVLYSSEQSGVPTALAPLELQYVDYVRWETQMLTSPEGERHWAYLQEQLAGELPVLNLPTDRPRPPTQTYHTASYFATLNANLIQQLKALAQIEGTTLYTVLVSAFFVLLYRYTDQEDILLSLSSEQGHRNFKGVVGYFVNQVPLRADLSENPIVREFLRKMHQTIQVAFEHQDYPSHLLASRLHVSRDPSRPPLFQTIFMLQELHQSRDIAPFLLGQEGGQIEVGGLKMASLDLEEQMIIFVDLQLMIIEKHGSFSALWQYNTDLFDATTIKRMAAHFQTLLEGIVTNPEYRISDISLLSEAERHQILVEWNDTKAYYPKDKCLHEMFEAQVELTPDVIAVVYEDQQLTYHELNVRANQLAHHLRTLGVGPEMMVGICVERSLEMIVGLLGILKAGGAYVPLDPDYPRERLAFMLEDARGTMLLTQEKLAPELPAHGAHVVCLDTDWNLISQKSKSNLASGVRTENLAYVIYTSGSTGRPKGVMISHRAICNHMFWMQKSFPLTETDKVLQKTPFSFDASIWEFYAPLLHGAQLVMAKPGGHQDPAYLVKVIVDQKITTLQLVPSLLRTLLQHGGLESCTSLRRLFCGGAGLPVELQTPFFTNPYTDLYNLYGPTEASIDATFWPCKPLNNQPIAPIGRPIANTKIYILDNHLQPVPIGIPGELHIGGDGLGRGYVDRPELTAEKFIPDPFSDNLGVRLYKTGDLARYLPNDNIEFLGRLDHQTKIRGFRIELGEIETVLRSHSMVREAVVVTREDGYGHKRLVAYIVPDYISDRLPYQTDCLVEVGQNKMKLRTEDISYYGVSLIGIPTAFCKGKHIHLRLLLPGDSEVRWLRGEIVWCQKNRAGIQFKISPAEQVFVRQSVEHLSETKGFLKFLQRTTSGDLRNYLKQKLPNYMVPSSLVFLSTLPLTPSGKVNRRELPAPEKLHPELDENFVAPRSPVERVLADIWCKLLDLDHIGSYDNFFELGGDSLTVTQLASRLRETFRLELPISELFEAPTIAKLAEVIEKSFIETEIQTIPRRMGTGHAPLSFSQQRLWFLEQFEGGSPTYNIPLDARLTGPLDIAIFERSINEIVQRHEVLRTSFKTVDGQPELVITPKLIVSLPVKDLRGLQESERKAEVRKLALMEAQRLFDLTQAPLFRITLLRLKQKEHIMLMTIHHIIYDGWSVGVFIKELTTLYEAFSAGKPSALPDLPIQYSDFAQWQREWLQGEVLEHQVSYWKRQLSGSFPVLELPTDRLRPAKRTFRGETQHFVLPKTLSDAIRSLSRQEKSTPFMTLLAAFNTLLYRFTGQEDISIGTPVANRNRAEIERLIGFFVNTLVLRTDLSGNPTFRELLERIREMALEAHAHQDMPFEQLVAELHPERTLNRQPLFQVMFVLQDAPIQKLKFSGITLEFMEVHTGTAMFDLTLEMVDTGQGLSGFFEYNTDLFDTPTITRMIEHFQTLLEGIVADPERRLSELPLLTKTEQHKILVEWNDTRSDYPKDTCIHKLFETQVERTPDAVAVVFNEKQMTYRELNRRANQLAHYLQKLGVGPEMLVGICTERSLEMLVGLLGILKSGAAYVPMDTSNPRKRLAFMLEDTCASVLVTQQHLREKFSTYKAHIVCLDSDWDYIVGEDDENAYSSVTAENLAYVIYTSGSVGIPKGVLITHRALVNRCTTTVKYYDLEPCDRLLQFSSISFDVSLEEIFPTLLSGATIVLKPNHGSMTFEALSALLEKEKLTVLNLPTAYWHEWVSELSRSKLQLPSTVRLVIVGTEQASTERLATWQTLVNDHVRWINAYGPTEATITTTMYASEACKEDLGITSVPIGRPIDNTQVYLLDTHLQPVPVGVPGELYIDSISLARGYLGQPELAADKFIPNPFSDEPGTRLYKTGDLARFLINGNIEFLGRVDYQVKVHGFRVELGEVETILTGHPTIREAVVVAKGDVSRNKQLIAYVVSHQKQEITVSELRDFIKNQLPDYMVPTTFMFLKALPLTPSGKVDRRAFPDPDMDRPDLTETFVAPRTPSEKVMADIWAGILRLERIGVHDNFFELGGHSLLSIQLISRVQKIFQVELPLQSLFESPTVAGLIQILDAVRQQGSLTAMPDTPVPDFYAEAVLDDTIRPETTFDIQQISEPFSIFLTGATGFLGAFLLYELLQQTRAEIYCLVRASSIEEGRKMIRNNLESYYLWNDLFDSRIIPIPGDLSQSRLGLSVEQFDMMAYRIDTIYHNGAMVNFVYPYSALKAPNVLGTQEILRLACHIKVKPVHYTSTLSVFESIDYTQKSVIYETDPLNSIEGIHDGYSQSKWVAEKLVTIAGSRGLPVCIYRPARISGQSRTGAWNTNDFICKMIKGCIQLGSVPHQDIMLDLTPVDYISSAIVHLSKQKESLGKAFHLVNPKSAHWSDVVTWIRSFNYPLREIPYEQWQTELIQHTTIQKNALSPFLPLFFGSNFQENEVDPQRFCVQNTFAGLEGSSIDCPPVDTALLHTYFSYFIRNRFLDPPRLKE